MVRNKIFLLLVAALMLVTLDVCAQKVKPGIEVLQEQDFSVLKGKRVGLLTNPSGVDHNFRSTIDILWSAPQVNLVALYGPEHGVRGDSYAGDKVIDSTDPLTGLPVFSLYGKYSEPSQEMLEGVDVMVYDIQDVGSRSYTFISSLGLLMRACAKKGIPVVVLDRPNPCGGNKVEGNYVEPGYFSFVSQYRIPYVYGLTVGELANLINEEGLNRGVKGDKEPLKCDLTVIPMQGWTRDMTYADTGLPWILPSPNIPFSQTAVCYPSAGIAGEFQSYVNIGIGYTLPFGVFAAEWIDADRLKERLDSYGIPGTVFRTIHYKPFSGSSAGKLLHGVQYYYNDYPAAVLTMTQFYVMQALHELYPEHNPFLTTENLSMFDLVCGTDYIKNNFSKDFKVSDIYGYWMKDAEDWRKLSEKYYIYR